MIFITGHRAVGKSVVGKILEEHNYWFLDVGPFWRNLRHQHDPLSSTETYADRMTDDFLAEYIAKQYENSYREKTDIAIGGFRSLPEIEYLASLLEGRVYPARQTAILYIDCPFDQALLRYQQREGIVNGRRQLEGHYRIELGQGLDEIAKANTIRIVNDGGLDSLRLRLAVIVNNPQEGYRSLKREKL